MTFGTKWTSQTHASVCERHHPAAVCLREKDDMTEDTRSFIAAAVPEVRGQRADGLSLAVGERLLGVLPAQSAVSTL